MRAKGSSYLKPSIKTCSISAISIILGSCMSSMPTQSSNTPQEISAKVRDTIPKIQQCFSNKNPVRVSVKSLSDIAKATRNSMNTNRILAIAFSRDDALSGNIWIQNKPIQLTGGMHELTSHEMVHIQLTEKESMQLTQEIERLGIRVRILWGDKYMETPAYLINELQRGKHKDKYSQITQVYSKFGINIPCLM